MLLGTEQNRTHHSFWNLSLSLTQPQKLAQGSQRMVMKDADLNTNGGHLNYKSRHNIMELVVVKEEVHKHSE
jgi:hypothetical protein